VDGELWYDSTNKDFKYQYPNVTAAGSWRTGNNMNTQRAYMGNTGIQTAALSVGGATVPPVVAVVEQYDGTSWTEVGDINTARWQLATGGTYTSAIAFGGATSLPAPGSSVANAETWTGSSWTEVSDLNQARTQLLGVGASSTSALAFGGYYPTYYALTETWNGSSWTEVNDLNTARRDGGYTGDATAALAIGGQANTPPGSTAATESWNGTNWTTLSATLNTDRGAAASSKISTTSALYFGGDIAPGRTGLTELYNGTSWSEQADLSLVRRNLGGAGSGGTSALAFGGEDSPAPSFAQTEEWTGAGAPVGAWSTGGNVNTARNKVMVSGAGTQTAALVTGGLAPSNVGNTELYDGSSWTEVSDLNTARHLGGS
jgi:hypothetical protein